MLYRFTWHVSPYLFFTRTILLVMGYPFLRKSDTLEASRMTEHSVNASSWVMLPFLSM
jgi:hypothetical protein